jgi:Arc/MetJ family transcription regulator
VRTNIDIDDDLLAKVMRLSGKKTKKAVVEEALQQYARRMALKDLLDSTRGIGWEGDLEEMRQDRTFAEDPTPFDSEK